MTSGQVLDKLARMQLAELQASRDWVRWILPRLGVAAILLDFDGWSVGDIWFKYG